LNGEVIEFNFILFVQYREVEKCFKRFETSSCVDFQGRKTSKIL